jgi:hypothetical protein
MATARVEFNEHGLGEVLLGPEIRAGVVAVAEAGKVYAESIAPRDSGHYADSFEVAESSVMLAGNWRAAAVLRNTAGYAAAVEYGYRGRAATPTSSANRILGRTLDHLNEPRA